MENATKALLIAGSVLIVILLIALGMRIFNSTSGTADQVEGTMQTTEMAMFNNKFLSYSGSQSGSNVKALANVVIAHNANSSRKVTFQSKTDATDIISAISGVDSSTKYTVTIEDNNPKDGYIDTILFTLIP